MDTRISGNHTVVSVTLTLHLEYMNTELKVPLRWTVVVKKEYARWVWIHRLASTPALDQDDGQAYPKDKQIVYEPIKSSY